VKPGTQLQLTVLPLAMHVAPLRHGLGLHGCGDVGESVDGVAVVIVIVVGGPVVVSAAVVSALVLIVVQGSSVVEPTADAVVRPVEKLQGSSTSGT